MRPRTCLEALLTPVRRYRPALVAINWRDALTAFETLFQVALQRCRRTSSDLGAPVCRLSACNPEYDHELSFAGPHGERGDRGNVAPLHRSNRLVSLLASATAESPSRPAVTVGPA